MYHLWDTGCKRNGFIMYDLWDTACKRNGFIEYIFVPRAEQSLCWKIEYQIFFLFTRYDLGETACKRNGFINIASFLVGKSLRAGKLSIRSFFIIFYV